MQQGVEGGLLTTGEAAQRLGISRHTLLRAVERGEIMPALRTPGGYLRFLPAAVEGYAHRLSATPAPQTPIADAFRARRSVEDGASTSQRLYTDTDTAAPDEPFHVLLGAAPSRPGWSTSRPCASSSSRSIRVDGTRTGADAREREENGHVP